MRGWPGLAVSAATPVGPRLGIAVLEYENLADRTMQAGLQLPDVCCRVVPLNFNCVGNSLHFRSPLLIPDAQRSGHSARQLIAMLAALNY